MAPLRKSRGVKKRFAYVNEVSPSKHAEDAGRSRQKKRKLSDLLGPQWSKSEIMCFYEAYRKYGKDWKKVATGVPNRSAEMVEALYSTNKAYLSLPEGSASVAGLVAMMSDHYSVLGGSDSDEKSSEERPQKIAKRKIQNRAYILSNEHIPDLPLSRAVASNDGCLTLLKNSNSGLSKRTVGKRTPRVPISHSDKYKEKYSSPAKQNLKFGGVIDDNVTQEGAMALTKASHSMENKKQEAALPSPRKQAEPKVTASKAYYSNLNGNGRKKGRNGVDAVDFQEKGKKKSLKFKEASNTTDARNLSAVKRMQTEIVENKGARSSSKAHRKKSRKSLFGDEDFPLEALQTLADLSSLMSNESPADEEKNFNDDSRYKLNETHAISGAEGTALRSPTLEEVKAERKSLIGKHRKKQKSPHKLQANEKEARDDTHPSDNQKTEATEEAKRSSCKGKRSSHNSVKVPKHLAYYMSDINSKRETNDSCRNKMNIQVKHTKSSEKVSDDQASIQVPLSKRELNLKEMLANCLSRHQARRWCISEWFYSAIDSPWFAKNEFIEYLNHVALGHIPRLARVEWGVIKGSLGKPRRFSEHFLKEEREKLNQYRESVRSHYAELREGIREGLPTDLAPPLSVGQHILAIHPKSRELHNGVVLAVEHSSYSVDFVQSNLGVENVMDIDCMPLNPVENTSESLGRHNLAVKNKLENGNDELKTRKQLISDDIDELLMCKETPIQARRSKEADIEAVSELMRVLDKKEAVVFELRYMTDVLEQEKNEENPLKDSEAFKKQYAAVLLLLNEVNAQVSSALLSLRERNTYERISPPIPKSIAKLNDQKGRSSSAARCNYQDCGLRVDEFLESSRLTAQKVVGVAMQALSSFGKRGENWEKSEEAIDFVKCRLSEEDIDVFPVEKPPTKGSSSVSPSLTHPNSTNPKLDSFEQKNPEIPSELIAHCVSTMLVIQKCSERQFPPSEVARVLDSAVTSLQPLCSDNLKVYEQIQKFMGIIRTQILALVPS